MDGISKKITLTLLLFFFGLSLYGQSLDQPNPVSPSLQSDVTAIVPGKSFIVGVLLRMEPGWHTYYREPGDSGLATSVQWELPKGFTVGELQWPAPIKETEPGDFKVNVYTKEVLLWAKITAPASIPEPQVAIRASVKWLACKESCIPGEAKLALTLPVSDHSQSVNALLFSKYGAGSKGGGGDQSTAAPGSLGSLRTQTGFWQYLLFAFIGGLILNVMPCVLPVISLKILGFLKHGNESPGRIRSLGIMYAVGVLASFLLLAAFVVIAQRAGSLAGWGLQFQSPVFVVAITVLVTLVSLNLFGLFEITLSSSTLTAVSGLASKEGYLGAFFNGVFAVILATPCTAPFLGAALGFAFLQSPAVIVLFFSTVAIGLAFPYVLICSFPQSIRFLPKPGIWMEHFKVAMGFPMLATAIWLFTVASRHYGSKTVWLGLFLITLALAMWIYGEFFQRGRDKRAIALTLVLLLVLGGYWGALENRLHWRNPEPLSVSGGSMKEDPDGIDWQIWSPETVELARSKGHPVLVDFTADWCLTCQTNKVTSLEIPSVREQLKAGGFVALVGDYTRTNDAITRELMKFRRAGVPLVVVYPAKGEPIVLPELLSPTIVLDALAKAKGVSEIDLPGEQAAGL